MFCQENLSPNKSYQIATGILPDTLVVAADFIVLFLSCRVTASSQRVIIRYCCRLEMCQEYERAAAIAVFTLKIARAIEVLRHGAMLRQSQRKLSHFVIHVLASK